MTEWAAMLQLHAPLKFCLQCSCTGGAQGACMALSLYKQRKDSKHMTLYYISTNENLTNCSYIYFLRCFLSPLGVVCTLMMFLQTVGQLPVLFASWFIVSVVMIALQQIEAWKILVIVYMYVASSPTGPNIEEC